MKIYIPYIEIGGTNGYYNYRYGNNYLYKKDADEALRGMMATYAKCKDIIIWHNGIKTEEVIE